MSDNLPDDPETLKAMLLAERHESERLRQIIKELQRHRFGRRQSRFPRSRCCSVSRTSNRLRPVRKPARTRQLRKAGRSAHASAATIAEHYRRICHGSRSWLRDAAENGVLRTLLRAGATVTSPGCGACHFGNETPLRLGDGETCITASVENYAGRMGSSKAKIYAANAAVVAASALAGEIADPRGYFK